MKKATQCIIIKKEYFINIFTTKFKINLKQDILSCSHYYRLYIVYWSLFYPLTVCFTIWPIPQTTRCLYLLQG